MTSETQLRRELEGKIKKAEKLGLEAVAAQSEAGRQAREGAPKTIELLDVAYPLLLELRKIGPDRAEHIFKGRFYLAYSSRGTPKQHELQWNKPAKENLALPLLKLLLPGASGGLLTKCAKVLRFAADEGLDVADFKSWLEGEHHKPGSNNTEKGLTGAYNAVSSTRRPRESSPTPEVGQPDESIFDWSEHTRQLLRFAKSMKKSDLPIELQPKHHLSVTFVHFDGDQDVCNMIEIPITEDQLKDLIVDAGAKLRETQA